MRRIATVIISEPLAACAAFITPDYSLHIGDVVFAGRDEQWLPAVDKQMLLFPGIGMTVHQVLSGEDWAAAWFSDDIVLKGVAVRYHGDAPGSNRLAWRDAVARAGEGWDFERILAAAYPQAAIATLSGREECARLEAAENWLARAIAGWDARLLREPGFEALGAPPKVCALADGHPYSDQKRLRIYARGWRNLDERVTLAHEYLHLAFRFHPNGADENYIERLARRLIES